MRTLKFRIWDHAEERFLPYPCWINSQNGNEFMAFDRYFDNKEEGCVIQEFSGILDKHGNEIFEGDIVRYSYRMHEHDIEETRGEVYFEDGIFHIDRSMEWATNDVSFITNSLEIVGNIFTNPSK